MTKWPPAAILDDRNSLSKLPPVAILDDRKSLSIAFLAISDKNATLFFILNFFHILDERKFQIHTQLCFFIFFSQNGRRPLSIAFLTILNKYASFKFFENFSQNGRQCPFWMTENHFRSHFSQFQMNTQLFFLYYKMAVGGHFG